MFYSSCSVHHNFVSVFQVNMALAVAATLSQKQDDVDEFGPQLISKLQVSSL